MDCRPNAHLVTILGSAGSVYQSGQHGIRHGATENEAVGETATASPQRAAYSAEAAASAAKAGQSAQRTDIPEPFHEIVSVTSGVKGRGRQLRLGKANVCVAIPQRRCERPVRRKRPRAGRCVRGRRERRDGARDVEALPRGLRFSVTSVNSVARSAVLSINDRPDPYTHPCRGGLDSRVALLDQHRDLIGGQFERPGR